MFPGIVPCQEEGLLSCRTYCPIRDWKARGELSQGDLGHHIKMLGVEKGSGLGRGSSWQVQSGTQSEWRDEDPLLCTTVSVASSSPGTTP